MEVEQAMFNMEAVQKWDSSFVGVKRNLLESLLGMWEAAVAQTKAALCILTAARAGTITICCLTALKSASSSRAHSLFSQNEIVLNSGPRNQSLVVEDANSKAPTVQSRVTIFFLSPAIPCWHARRMDLSFRTDYHVDTLM